MLRTMGRRSVAKRRAPPSGLVVLPGLPEQHWLDCPRLHLAASWQPSGARVRSDITGSRTHQAINSLSCHQIMACSWRPSSTILPNLSFQHTQVATLINKVQFYSERRRGISAVVAVKAARESLPSVRASNGYHAGRDQLSMRQTPPSSRA